MNSRPVVTTLLLLAASAFACQGRGESQGGATVPRQVVTYEWDTVFVAGGSSVNDTLFAGPHRLALTDDLVVVGDDMASRVIALDRSTGAVKWTFGRPGGGPKEFRGIADIAVSRRGMIWVLDFGNGRIAELSPGGEFRGVRTLHHLPAPPAALLPLDQRIIAMSPGAARPFMEIGYDSLVLQSSFRLEWPDSISRLANTRVHLAAGPGDSWVSAFALGPGFTIWQHDTPSPHRYREDIPFASRVSREIRNAGADSARYGAVAIAVANEEIFMLFGGRPARRAHPSEPTHWIDVYDIGGNYSRSYRLPFNTQAMVTDGRVFFVLPAEGVPRLIALRPDQE